MYTFTLELICTTQNKNDKFYRLIDSVIACAKRIQIHFILIDQCEQIFKYKNIDLMKLTHIKTDKIPLSVARNIGIKNLVGWEYVGFPDDDCWYDEDEILNALKSLKVSNAGILCTNVYDPIRNEYYGRRPILKLNIHRFNILTIPISVGIFFKTNVVKFNNLYFNENLGAGTNLGSGEESEFLVRLFENGFSINYDGTIKIFHEVESETITPEKAYKYSYGYSALISSIGEKYNKSYYYTFLKIFFLVFLRLVFIATKKRKISYQRIKGLINGFKINIYDKKV